MSVLPEEAQKALRKGKDSNEGNEGLRKKELNIFERVPNVVHVCTCEMWHLNAFDALRSPSKAGEGVRDGQS